MIHIGGACSAPNQQEGMFLLKHRATNGRRITILNTSIAVSSPPECTLYAEMITKIIQ